MGAFFVSLIHINPQQKDCKPDIRKALKGNLQRESVKLST